jgi:hypothetical protein
MMGLGHESAHEQLAMRNRDRLSPRLPNSGWPRELADEHQTRLLEAEVLESERRVVAMRAALAPSDRHGFLRWFEELREVGPGQNDPLFPWLATEATADQVRWFLRQELAAEAGFEDLVALAQLRMPMRPKLELARNYWEEMGRGVAGDMHGPMLSRLAASVKLDELADSVAVVWEALALGNIMLGLAANRRYAFHALGALGVVELTAPSRAVHIGAALTRLGVNDDARHYYALHAMLDVEHSTAWNTEVLAPMVEREPRTARAIAEGALMRLEAAARCYARYRRELGVPGGAADEVADPD